MVRIISLSHWKMEDNKSLSTNNIFCFWTLSVIYRDWEDIVQRDDKQYIAIARARTKFLKKALKKGGASASAMQSTTNNHAWMVNLFSNICQSSPLKSGLARTWACVYINRPHKQTNALKQMDWWESKLTFNLNFQTKMLLKGTYWPWIVMNSYALATSNA